MRGRRDDGDPEDGDPKDGHDEAAAIVIHLDTVLSERQMTLTELSERVGVSIVNLSVLKNGRARAIRFSTLARLCRVLDLPARRPAALPRRSASREVRDMPADTVFRVTGLRLEDGRHLDREVIDKARQQNAGSVPCTTTGLASCPYSLTRRRSRGRSTRSPSGRSRRRWPARWRDSATPSVPSPSRQPGRRSSAARPRFWRRQSPRSTRCSSPGIPRRHPKPSRRSRRRSAPIAPDPVTEPDPPAASRPVHAEPLQPVTDLRARAIRSRKDIVQPSWSPPPAGMVTLRIAA